MTELKLMYVPSSVKGQRLHTLIWEPADTPRAVVQIAHGMAEHIARYDGFARWLNEHGIAVIGASHLGHGLSAKTSDNLGFFARRKGWEHLVADTHLVRQQAQKLYPDVPCFLLGHSMGSFIARTYITKPFAEGLAGVILGGTADQSAALVGAGAFIAGLCTLFQGGKHRSKLINSLSFGSYNKQFEPARTPYDWLSRNESDIDRYNADPLCGFCFTLSAFGDLFDGLKYIAKPKNIAKADKGLPCLFIAGDRDPVGDCGKGVRSAAQRFTDAGMTDVQVRLYPDARHEVLNETNCDEVYADVLAFIEHCFSPSAQAAETAE